MDLDEIFKKASSHVRSLKEVGEEDMLKFYGLYKQANEGSCNTSKPYFWDFTASAKWKSWKACSNLSREDAKIQYIALVKQLDKFWDEQKEADNEHNKKTTDGSSGGSGMGIRVSTMQYETEEEILDQNKTIFNWCEEGNVNEMKKMIENNPLLIQLTDNNGLSLLHWAVDRGFVDVIKYLISCKCDLNKQDEEDKQTPLHYAVTCEHREIINILIKAGADVNLLDSDGNKAVDCTNNIELRKLFKNY